MENPATHHSLTRWIMPSFLLDGGDPTDSAAPPSPDGSDGTVRSTVALASDVPVPYADATLPSRLYGKSRAQAVATSWAVRGGTALGGGGGFGTRHAAQHGQQQAAAAAFISNCGPQKRLEWLQGMMDAGIVIHSYGRCLHNIQADTHESKQPHSTSIAQPPPIPASPQYRRPSVEMHMPPNTPMSSPP